jgi:ferrochelatase
MNSPSRYDALLLVSFGGPEKHEDVIPFLENVLRGRNVPRERMLAVAEHYYHFDGKSPINEQCRRLVDALEGEFSENGITLPIYWGNRNWHPMLAHTVRQMRDDGIRHALAIVTSAFGSFSGCRQYREDIEAACAPLADAPKIDKLPPYWNHPAFIETMTDRVRYALTQLPGADVVYTAHSIPVAMAKASPYERQLREACALVNRKLDLGEPVLVFQSRSGPPSEPWLEPDIADYVRTTDSKRLVVAPIGFLSDHMEVQYDLDTVIASLADQRGIAFIRAGTAGTHPRFIAGVGEMVRDALARGVPYFCDSNCCAPAHLPAASRQRAF